MNVIGVRREDKNKWERRVPVTPAQVSALVADGVRVLVQPSSGRIFRDEEYTAAGAILQEDLSEAGTILAVKEVPIHLIMPNKTYVFFSHTIKGQPSNMPLLDAILEKRIRMLDYECITEGGVRGAKRLVAFGRFAGIAGAIDFCRGMGERLLARGFSTPFLEVGSTYMYPSVEAAKAAIAAVGEAIRQHGLPQELCPLTCVFTGRGNVSKGAQEVFELLPFKAVAPGELRGVVEGATGKDRTHVLYLCEATAEHMVKRVDFGPPVPSPSPLKGNPKKRRRGEDGAGVAAAAGAGGAGDAAAFDSAHYRAHPEDYVPVFHETVLPYTSILLNCMYWNPSFPRLVTIDQARTLHHDGRLRLWGVCDITCDFQGSVEFLSEFTTIEAPFYVYNPETEEVSHDMDDYLAEGVLYHSVDHLPSECPREASMHFGSKLLPFLKALANSDGGRPWAEQTDLPPEMRGAVIAVNGALTPGFTYIDSLRQTQVRAQTSEAGAKRVKTGSAFLTIRLEGHLFDRNVINLVLDLVEDSKASCKVQNVTVGSDATTPTSATLQLYSTDPAVLGTLVASIRVLCNTHSVFLSSPDSEGVSSTVVRLLLAPAPSARRRILLLGAGLVTPPLVQFLLRRRENVITAASMYLKEAEALSGGRARVVPAQLDVTKDAAGLAALVAEHDIVISLVPATFHAVVAQAAIAHKVDVVTASYVSPAMAELDAAATAAGIVVLNECGLDPGIDHMSAMKMIDGIKARGGSVDSFSSLCGGLPAPEAANNPFGYKFSWSPRGALSAASNPAKYRKDGALVEVPGGQLLKNAAPTRVNPAFALEVLPNRDSLPYAPKYGIPEATTMFRGTLRYEGCSQLLAGFADVGLLDGSPDARLAEGAPPMSRLAYLAALVGAPSTEREAVLEAAAVAGGLPPAAAPRFKDCVTWCGMAGKEDMPRKGTPLDAFVAVLTSKPEMSFGAKERDMALMHHEVVANLPDGTKERHTATMVQYKEKGNSAMARTVGITAAIATQLILDGKVAAKGVVTPVTPEWYNPILTALEAEGIGFTDTVATL